VADWRFLIDSFEGVAPKIHPSVLLADGCQIIGDVGIGQQSSIWFNSTVRGDVNYIRIGERTSIQDQTVIHVASLGEPTIIGNNVTVGHRVILHACTVEDLVLVGMGAIVMDGAVIGTNSIVAAGAVVTPGRKFPAGSMIMGCPAEVKRPLTQKELEFLPFSAERYVRLATRYHQGT
jgi:carbonic anhydrase/acetyltransferase-like protein (isoleucine patch superfamily)